MELSISGTSKKILKKVSSISDISLRLFPGEYTTGTYVVSLKSCSTEIVNHSLSFILKQTPEVIQVYKNIECGLIESGYFKYCINLIENSRLEVLVDSLLGNLNMFASFSNKFPDESDYEFCVGTFAAEEVTDLEEFTPDKQTFVRTNLYDKIVPRNFTRKSRINKLENENSCSSLRLCIDSEEWEDRDPIIYFKVVSKNPNDQNIKIQANEYAETDLLSTEIKANKLVFDSIFKNIDGSNISKLAQKQQNLVNCKEFTYGEIEYISLTSILELCNLKPNEIFWDLGCGLGKCLSAVYLNYPSIIVKGVEYIEELYNICCQNLSSIKFNENIPQVIHGDLMKVDWADADIVYCANICFPDDLNAGLTQKLLNLKPKSRVLLLKRLDIEGYKLVFNSRIKMSWGKTQIFLLEKY